MARCIVSAVVVTKVILHREAYKAIRKAILNGRYRPGARLIVRELAEELGLSPTPIKEALAALEREGLVKSTPHKGYQVFKPSLEDAQEIYELRESLEGLAARLATLRGGEGLVNALTALWEKQREAADRRDLEAYGDFDIGFHRTLWEAAGNKRLRHIAENLDGQVRLLISTSAAVPGRLPLSIEEHRRIIEAIRKRDASEAEAAMRQHIYRAWCALKEFLDPGSFQGLPRGGGEAL